ncbi:pre-piRNA 3'-exonuclease trimmer-like isoform X3 [Bacillus rossius redtenbacheri]|uniref:pre-piRNA 3'-exonuclease trimmer-like isoform X3 n=1 Tax=Bacillus rossius redtenbacheri TaxID=93214 RepID=UPI002FDCB4B1
MCEVVRSNFEEKFPEIEQTLKEATFIAVDAEFSGGISNAVQSSKPSLFDSASERYAKLLRNLDGCIIIQMGLTAFRFHRDENKYVASTYNFYVFPKPFASVDMKFVMQSSSVEFLCLHGFDFNKVLVVKVSESERERLEEQERRENTLDRQFLQSALGFSKVFGLLADLKKPLVGHNLLLDLMFMYSQFHEPLPAQYLKFKKKISELFPTVFDTKYVSFELMKELRKEDKWVSNILEEMYTYFKEARGREIVMYSPLVESTNGFHSSDVKKKFHEAGWDSYCTGFCFVKMMHIIASISHSRHGFPRALTSSEHLAAVARMKGCVNMIRASVSHVCLLGDDPPSRRPRLLHVAAKGPRVISSLELAALFAAFGAVDVKLCSKRRALVAVGTHRIARDALSSFKGHKELDVSLYSPLRHSLLVRGLLWIGLVTSLAGCSWLVMRSLNKN